MNTALVVLSAMITTYDYYAFAVQDWCSTGTFQIHGLWPQNNDGTYPSWCQGQAYVPVSGPLFDIMTTNWNA